MNSFCVKEAWQVPTSLWICLHESTYSIRYAHVCDKQVYTWAKSYCCYPTKFQWHGCVAISSCNNTSDMIIISYIYIRYNTIGYHKCCKVVILKFGESKKKLIWLLNFVTNHIATGIEKLNFWQFWWANINLSNLANLLVLE